jgi:hypothetical protein
MDILETVASFLNLPIFIFLFAVFIRIERRLSCVETHVSWLRDNTNRIDNKKGET